MIGTMALQHVTDGRGARTLLARWMLACAAGEAAGIAVAAAVMVGLDAALGEPTTPDARLAVLVCTVAAGMLEGLALGFFQWRVLRTRFPRMEEGEWIGPTMTMAALGWLLGMLPSLFLVPHASPGAAPAGPGAGMAALFALLFGAAAGAAFGAAQWTALRRHAAGAGRWMAANALGWALATTWISLAARAVPAGLPPLAAALVGAAAGVAAGLSVGVATGSLLVRLQPVGAEGEARAAAV